MAQPTQDQVQMANEVLAGTREITGTTASPEPPPPETSPAPVAADPLASVPDEDRRAMMTIGESYQNDLKSYESAGQPYNVEAFRSDLSKDQFERSETAENIQRVHDIKGPGE